MRGDGSHVLTATAKMASEVSSPHFSWVNCEAVLPWSTMTVCETGRWSRTWDAMMMLTGAGFDNCQLTRSSELGGLSRDSNMTMRSLEGACLLQKERQECGK